MAVPFAAKPEIISAIDGVDCKVSLPVILTLHGCAVALEAVQHGIPRKVYLV